jgi:hypothetical protein
VSIARVMVLAIVWLGMAWLAAVRGFAQEPAAAKPAEGEETTEAVIAKLAIASPCAVKRAGGSLGSVDGWIALNALGVTDVTPGKPVKNTATAATPATIPAADQDASKMLPDPCGAPAEAIDYFKRFLTGPATKQVTPKDKAWLAARDVMDPFNALTILFSSAITIGTNSHSAYGPGFRGFGRYVGVSYTQDMTGEFFSTFLIDSIARQDPHYHRMATGSLVRRGVHAALQVLWTEGDNGKGMLNYGNLVGFAIDDEIGNLYVPGQQTHASATVERYFSGLASAPIDNFITEFLPDIASHIHVRVVLIQRIINQVAKSGGTSSSP